MSDAIFGSLVTGTDVEQAALDTLQTWSPTYLAWVERHTGRAAQSVPAPRSWITSADFTRWPEEQLPSVLLLSPGLAEEPSRDGRGSIRAKFALGVAVVVSARDRAETDALAKLYVAAFRAAILQHPSLGGFAEGVEWLDERYDALPGDPKRRRTLAAGQLAFRVDVRGVVEPGTGPTSPSPTPYEPQPDPTVATSVEVDVQTRS